MYQTGRVVEVDQPTALRVLRQRCELLGKRNKRDDYKSLTPMSVDHDYWAWCMLQLALADPEYKLANREECLEARRAWLRAESNLLYHRLSEHPLATEVPRLAKEVLDTDLEGPVDPRLFRVDNPLRDTLLNASQYGCVHWFRVPFESACRLVGKRYAIVNKGFAYFQMDRDFVSILLDAASKRFAAVFDDPETRLAGPLAYLRTDTRLRSLVKHARILLLTVFGIRSASTSLALGNATISSIVDIEDLVPGVSGQLVPACMHAMDRKGHLVYAERTRFTWYAYRAGLKRQAVLRRLRPAFMTKYTKEALGDASKANRQWTGVVSEVGFMEKKASKLTFSCFNMMQQGLCPHIGQGAEKKTPAQAVYLCVKSARVPTAFAKSPVRDPFSFTRAQVDVGIGSSKSESKRSS